MEGRALAQRYAESHQAPWDWELMRSLVHPDYVEEWPQSGERIRGFENKRAILENYPSGLPESGLGTRRIVGSDDRDIYAPSLAAPVAFFAVLRVVGSGDTYTFEGTARYQTGEPMHVVAIIEIRDGKVWRQTTYFAAPFEAPEWRSQWVERMS